MLRKHKQDWEEMASVDPLWAIISDPEHRSGRWSIDEFLATGEEEIAETLEIAGKFGLPERMGKALDFGCGVGRVTRAMASRFEECYGADISEEMIARAKNLNADKLNCTFVVNVTPNLRQFGDQMFDFVYCNLVLQHQPNPRMARRYIAELLRVLRPGGLLIFQLPYDIPFRNRLQLRRRLYALLRRLGINTRLLYNRAGLNPIRMISIPQREVRDFVEKSGGRIIHTESADDAVQPISGLYYYVSLNDGSNPKR